MAKTLRINFDHAAGGVLRPELRQKMPELLERYSINPHGLTCFAEEVRRALLAAESRLLKAIGASDDFAVIWCSGGTECANLALRGLQSTHRIICAADTHPALFRTAESLAGSPGSSPPFTLKACSLVNNETGAITLPYRRDASEHILLDCCQATGKIAMPGCENYDLAILSGRKIGGPASSAALVMRKKLLKNLSAEITGGGQQRNLRSGTIDAVSAILLADAAEMAIAEQPRSWEQARKLNNHLRGMLSDSWPVFSPALPESSPFILAFAIPDHEGALITRIMAENHGILIGAGSACSAETNDTSPTLKTAGIPEKLARAMLRISFDSSNTIEEIDQMMAYLNTALKNY